MFYYLLTLFLLQMSVKTVYGEPIYEEQHTGYTDLIKNIVFNDIGYYKIPYYATIN